MLWGSKRTGPDLARIGGKYSDFWHVAHLTNPRDVVPESNMPAYRWLARTALETDDLAHASERRSEPSASRIRMRWSRTPRDDAFGQATPDGDFAAGVTERYGEETQVSAFDGVATQVTEMDALVAYFQILGRMTDAAYKNTAAPGTSARAGEVTAEEAPMDLDHDIRRRILQELGSVLSDRTVDRGARLHVLAVETGSGSTGRRTASSTGTTSHGSDERDPVSGRETTGHEWNGIKELDTPVPRGVLIFLIVTHIWAIVWWFLVPAWPLGTTYTKGFLGGDQKQTVEESVSSNAQSDAPPG